MCPYRVEYIDNGCDFVSIYFATDHMPHARRVVMHAIASVTAHHITSARGPADSVKRHHPGGNFSMALSDELSEWGDPEGESFYLVVAGGCLSIAGYKSPTWAFKHTILEVCAAVKDRGL